MIAAYVLGVATGSLIVWLADLWGRYAGRQTTKHRSCWDAGCTLNIGHIGAHSGDGGTWWR